MISWKNPNLIYALIFLIAILTFFDIYTTNEILSKGGSELNPHMAPFMDYFIYIRIGALILIILLAKMAEKIKSGSGKYPLISANAMFIIPVVNNLLVLRSVLP